MLTHVATLTDSQLSIMCTEFFHVLLSPHSQLPPNTVSTLTASPAFPHLVTSLLKNMAFTLSEQQALVQKNSEDLSEQVNVRKKDRSASNGDDDDDDDDDDGEGDVDFENGEDSGWTIRKCSAATLDNIAVSVLPSVTLPIILPVLQQCLASADPWTVEGAILALGAIAAHPTGQEVEQHLPQLYPYLLTQLTAALPQLVEIACWTMSRYAGWVIYMEESQQMPNILSNHITQLLQAMMLPSRSVQNAAVTSLSRTIELADNGGLIEPHLGPILATLTSCLTIYTHKPLLTLCETFGVIADFVGAPLGPHCATFMPTLLSKWTHLDGLQRRADYSDTDEQGACRRSLVPLLECIGCAAIACGEHYRPFAAVSLATAMGSVEHNVLRVVATASADESDSDVTVCCLDIIDALIEAFQGNFQALLGSLPGHKGESLLPLVQQATSFPVAGVRMSGFALVGDLCKHCPEVIQSGLGEIFKMLGDGLSKNLQHDKVLNNVLWATGELFNRCRNPPPHLIEILSAVQQRMATLIWDLVVAGQSGIAENASVAMGRMAQVDGRGFGVSAVVREDIARWFEAIGNVRDRAEKNDAFLGCICAIGSSPDILMGESHRPGSLSSLFMCIANFHVQCDENGDYESASIDHLHGKYMFVAFPEDMRELEGAVKKLLGDVRGGLGAAEYGKVVARLPGNVRKLIEVTYA